MTLLNRYYHFVIREIPQDEPKTEMRDASPRIPERKPLEEVFLTSSW
jgi:hypothetical protein